MFDGLIIVMWDIKSVQMFMNNCSSVFINFPELDIIIVHRKRNTKLKGITKRGNKLIVHFSGAAF